MMTNSYIAVLTCYAGSMLKVTFMFKTILH